MSKIVRRLAAVAVIAAVLGVPGLSFAAAPVDRVSDDAPAAFAGFGGVLFDLLNWVRSVFGADESTGTGGGSGEASGGTGGGTGEASGSNTENNNPPGGGDAGPGTDPHG